MTRFRRCSTRIRTLRGRSLRLRFTLSATKRTAKFMLCLLITRKNWKRRCSDTSIEGKKTGGQIRLRDRSRSRLLRAVDLSDGVAPLVIHDEVRILEATIELLSGLFLIALVLVITLSICGSIVAALRAVAKGNSHVDKRPRPLATAALHHRNNVAKV
jgi:hypothetical protein